MQEFNTTIEPRDDAEIIGLILQDRSSLFNLLVERYRASVRSWIKPIVKEEKEVDDLVQETFLNAWQRLDTLHDHERFAAWLRSIAVNNARMWHRRHHVQLSLIDSLKESDEFITTQTSLSVQDWKKKVALRTALSLLTPAYRTVVEHHYFKGHSYAQTARLLAINVDTVRSRLQKARTRIRKEISGMSEDALMHNVLELNRNDLQMLRSAAQVRQTDNHLFPAIHGVLITEEGEIVATDAHMLLIRSSENSGFGGNRVLLGECRAEMIPDTDRALLHLGLSEALLEVDGRSEIAFTVLNETFPEYWHLIPRRFNTVVSIRQESLLERLGTLPSLNESKDSTIRLSIDKENKSLLIRYEEDYKGHHITAVPLQTLEAFDEGTSWLLNIEYFHKLIAGLGHRTDKEIILAIGFIGAMESMVVYEASDPQQKSVLAPIRRQDQNSETPLG